MDEKKTQIRSRTKNAYTPFLVLAVFEIIFHIFFTQANFGDDVVLIHNLDNTDFLTWSKDCYLNWSSRIFVNGTCVLVVRSVLAWKILDSAAIVLLVYSISTLFLEKQEYVWNWTIVCLFLIYPFADMAGAGWIGTTVSYLWSVATGLYCCTLLKRKKSTSWFHYVSCGAAALYASNAEQLSVVLFVILLCIGLYGIWKKNKYLVAKTIFLLSIVTGNLVLHLTCPGNSNRSISETINWTPDFQFTTLVEKLQIGFCETMSKCLLSPNLLFLTLTGILLFVICLKFRNLWCRVIAIVPFAICVGIGFLSPLLLSLFPALDILAPPGAVNHAGAYGGLVTFYNFRSTASYIPLALLIFCMIICAVEIYLSIDDQRWSLLSVLIYFCGIGSGMIMGFSPTVYASGPRTFINTYFCFVVVIFIIAVQNAGMISSRVKRCALYGLFIVAGFNTLSVIVQAAKLLPL